MEQNITKYNPETVTEKDSRQIQETIHSPVPDPQVFRPDPATLPEETEHPMTAVEFLSRGRLMMKQIEAKNDQILQLDSLSKRITSSWQREVVSRTRDVTAREEIIARLMDKEAELQQDIQRMLEIRDEIAHVIERVRNPKIRLVLEKYYLCNLSWAEVAADMNYSTAHVQRLAGRGVKMVQVLLNKG